MTARQYRPIVDAIYVQRYIQAHIAVSPEGCWVWTGATRYGYGRARIRQLATPLAHRVAFEAYVGAIPNGLQLDHLCRNRACVNPDHLEPVSAAENVHRAFDGRMSCLRGHPFTVSNTYQRYPHRRECRACHRAQEMARKQRARAAA